MKPWWKSRTIWAQLITALIAILTAVSGQELIADYPQLVSLLLLLLAVLNAVLRWLTEQPIASFHRSLDGMRGRRT